jgi:1-acyl-sn-glycerol-3-phosphate acyltransferase
MTKHRPSRMAGNSKASRAFYWLGRTLVIGFFRLWTRLTVEGQQHVPATGAYVVAPAGHRSNVDTPATGAISRRRLRFMGKDTLWKSRPGGWLLSALGGFPVVRGTADREALRRCIEVVMAGEPLVVFPEGERKSGPMVQPLFDGAAYIACRCRVPIVPVGIGGSERVMPKGKKMLRPRKMHLVVGPPLMPPVDAEGRVRRRGVKELTEQLHAELQRLFDEAQAKAGA